MANGPRVKKAWGPLVEVEIFLYAPVVLFDFARTFQISLLLSVHNINSHFRTFLFIEGGILRPHSVLFITSHFS